MGPDLAGQLIETDTAPIADIIGLHPDDGRGGSGEIHC